MCGRSSKLSAQAGASASAAATPGYAKKAATTAAGFTRGRDQMGTTRSVSSSASLKKSEGGA